MLQLNIATFLTLFRLLGAPMVLPWLITSFLPNPDWSVHCVIAVIFIIFAITDFFDGYFARKFDKVSFVGKVLDPVADKFLLFSTLIALLAIHRIGIYWVIILIGREFFIMALRIIAVEYGLRVPVSWFGKCKTAAQMIYLTFLIMKPIGIESSYLDMLEMGMLILVIVLSLGSAYDYVRSFLKESKQMGVG